MAGKVNRSKVRKKSAYIAKTKVKKTIPRIAIIDHLSGLYNRRHFDTSLKKIITESKKKGDKFALLMIDIDNFKAINDKYGHLAGDDILITLGKILKKSTRTNDICFRYGGDEFAIILPNIKKEAADNVVLRLKTKVEKYKFPVNEHEAHLKISMGLAIFPEDAQKFISLVKRADELLYRTKRQKRRKTKIPEPFILRTKLSIPVLKETVISRPRLISLLKENLDKKLIHVVADAGYGKTTLLTQLIHEQELISIFYNLDKGDSDLMLFLSYIIEGLNQIQPNLTKLVSNLLKQRTEVTTNYELIIGTLINELNEKLDQELYFVLDDYHTISKDSLVHNALNYFINNMPNKVHVIIASRTAPPLFSLAKLQSKQNLFELSREDLKFTSEEIKTLLSRVYRVLLTDEELRRVSDHTEGWITGIQLIIQSAGKDRKTVKETLNGYIEANQPLFDYFANEILARENVEIRDFLKYSSILEIMTPDACDTILNVKNSAHLLKDLERRHLFLSAVGKGEYKYHHLFQDFLHDRITDKNLKKDLNLKAAKYFKRKGQIEQAIKHYLEVGHYEWAGKLIVQVENQMRTQARYTTLSTWLNQIPENILDKQPRLLTALGRLYVIQGSRQQAEQMFIQAEKLLDKKTDKVALAEALKAHSSLILGSESRHEDALKIIRKALRICPAGEHELKIEILITIGRLWRRVWDFKKAKPYLLKAYRMAECIRDVNKMVTIANNLALQFVTQGELQTAFKTFKQLIERIKDNYWADVGIVFNNAVTTALALGKVEWAEQCLDKGWTLCAHHEDIRSKTALHRAFGALYIQKAQWDLAEQHLQKAASMAAKTNWTLMEFFLSRTMSRFYRYRADLSNAEKYLNMMLERLDKRNSPNEAAVLVEMGYLYVALGQFEKADKVIKASLKLIQKYGLNVLKFSSFLVRAAIALEQHKDQIALKLLKQAFHIAKIKGYDGLLLLELWHNPRLAQFARKSNIESNYILWFSLPKDMRKVVIQIQHFGGLHLRDSKGKPISLTWITEKSRSLFAFLVAHRGLPVHREIIIEKFWPDLPKKRANERFRNTASRMRQSLLDVLPGKLGQDKIFIRQRGTYQLLPEVEFRVDTEQFNLLLKEAEMTESSDEKVKFIQQALDLYKGDYLPEVYDSWADVFRERFREQKLNALQWLAQYAAQKGNDVDCVSICKTYLSINPLSEDMVRLYMKSLIRLGRLAEVKKLYSSFKQILQQELQSAPSEETRDLYLSILKSHLKT